MEIHILLAGVEFGPYTDTKARELIADGFLSASDPARRGSDADWIPLSEVLTDSLEDAGQEKAPPEDEPPAKAPEPQFPEDEPPAQPLETAPKETSSMPALRERPRGVEPFLSTWEKEPAEPARPVEEPTTSTPAQEEEPLPVFSPEPEEKISREFREQAESVPEITEAPTMAGLISSEPDVASSPREKISLSGPLAPAPPVPAPVAASAPPMIHVSLPSKVKGAKAGRTGSLLAKEALLAARARAGSAPPPPTPAPAPPKTETLALKTEPRPKSKIVLRDRDETKPPPAPGKTIPIARKQIRLTQPLTLSPATPEPAAKKIATRETGKTGKILIGQIARPAAPSARETEPLPIEAPEPPAAPETRIEPAPAGSLLSETPTGEQTAPTALLPPDDPTGQKPALSDTSSLTSSGDLAEKRSLKITGSLRQSTPRTPIRLSPSSPYKPGDSGRLATPLDEPGIDRPATKQLPVESKLWPPQRPSAFPITRIPAAENPLEAPELKTESAPEKTSVPGTPLEGLTIWTRRPTTRIPAPAEAKAPFEFKAPAPLAPPVPEPAPETTALVPPEISSAPPIPDLSEPAPAPPAPLEEPAEAPVTEALAPAPEIAKPEKIRLRRPVKLELSSRAKNPDSGRLTLEDFSKIAPSPVAFPVVDLREAVPATPVKPPEPSVSPSATGSKTIAATPSGAATLEEPKAKPPVAPVEDFRPPRLTEVKRPDFSHAERPDKQNLIWLAYAVITLGLLAAILIFLLAWHRNAALPSSSPAAVKSAPAQPKIAVVKPVSPAPKPPPVPPPPPVVPATPDVRAQVNAFVTEGIAEYQQGSQDAALLAFNHALDLDPKSADALYNRGISKAAQQDFDGAVADYSQALQIDPKLANAYYYRGLARSSKGELDGALVDYNQAIQVDPKNPRAFFDRGLIRMQKDDIDGAIVDSGRALELDPQLVQAYYNRGLGRLAKGALDAALSDMRAFCQLAPHDDPFTDYARLYIWLILTQQNQLAEANQELNKSMSGGWNGAPDSMVTKIGEFLLGQISENDLVAASASPIPVKDQGQRCEAWYFIGMRRLEAGDKDNAADDLQKCIATQKTDYCEYILAQEEIRSLNPTASGSVVHSTTPAPPPAGK